jgi:hypothetical protein
MAAAADGLRAEYNKLVPARLTYADRILKSLLSAPGEREGDQMTETE